MITLFIDTSSSDVSIALIKDNIILSKIVECIPNKHSVYTVSYIDKVLKKANKDVSDVQRIMVVNGPGSFTGVRIGVTIAKMLAYTLNIPIKTISSLELYAISSKSINNKIVVIHDIKGVFAGLFNDNKLIGDYFYKSNLEFEKYIKDNKLNDNIIDDNYIDFNKVYEYMKDKQPINPHQVNPIYIKTIEVFKND